MSLPNPEADFYFARPGRWQEAVALLRGIALSTGLDEAVKWGCPCYMRDGRNIVLIHAFKDYCAFLFFKGALMTDESGILVRQSPAVQLPRQIRFTSADQIAGMDNLLKACIGQAIEVEASGAKLEVPDLSDMEVPVELSTRLEASPLLREAFDQLTPGRRRAWVMQIGSAKQAKTREARMDKAAPLILAGRGPGNLG